MKFGMQIKHNLVEVCTKNQVFLTKTLEVISEFNDYREAISYSRSETESSHYFNAMVRLRGYFSPP